MYLSMYKQWTFLSKTAAWVSNHFSTDVHWVTHFHISSSHFSAGKTARCAGVSFAIYVFEKLHSFKHCAIYSGEHEGHAIPLVSLIYLILMFLKFCSPSLFIGELFYPTKPLLKGKAILLLKSVLLLHFI